MTAVETLLGDPAAHLSLPIADLTHEADRKQLERFIHDQISRDRPSTLGYLAKALGGILVNPAGGAGGLAMDHFSQTWKHNSAARQIFKIIDKWTVRRPVLSLTDKEKAIIRANASCIAQRSMQPAEWRRFLALLIWNDGRCTLEAEPGVYQDPTAHRVRDMLHSFLAKSFDKHDVFLATSARTLAAIAQQPPNPFQARAPALLAHAVDTGARWMTGTDLAASRYYKTQDTPQSLILGYEPHSGQPVTFSGNESLITIGGPGSGKSQCQVIPNLLRYRGSAIVLDVKGELWEATAAWRQKHYGPVYRFAPTDPSGKSHRYNPFDFISRDPATAADQATVFTYQVVVDNPNLNDPYWENKGRDLMWAFAMMVALKAAPDTRNLRGLTELMSLPLDKDPDADIHKIVDALRRLARKTNIFDLEAAANAISSGVVSPRLESVMDNGRRYLSIFTRSPNIEKTIATSDWRPEWFRSRPGTTLYICVPPAELKSYAPLIRVILIQHARILMRHTAKPGELPITFFLDEMPQLGNFESILEMQDVGRGAGLRLWMFAQYIGQLEQAFGKKYKGVVDACRARSFLQPDMELVNLIQPGLGHAKNPFTGETKKLAEDYELTGKAYDDRIILTTRGDHPMVLDKKYAWQTDKNKILPPPAINRLP